MSQFRFGKKLAGKVFKVKIDTFGPGHRDRHLDVDLPQWPDCQQCSEFRSLLRLLKRKVDNPASCFNHLGLLAIKPRLLQMAETNETAWVIPSVKDIVSHPLVSDRDFLQPPQSQLWSQLSARSHFRSLVKITEPLKIDKLRCVSRSHKSAWFRT